MVKNPKRRISGIHISEGMRNKKVRRRRCSKVPTHNAPKAKALNVSSNARSPYCDGGQELEGNRLVQDEIEGFVHFAHSALTQHPENAVSPARTMPTGKRPSSKELDGRGSASLVRGVAASCGFVISERILA